MALLALLTLALVAVAAPANDAAAQVQTDGDDGEQLVPGDGAELRMGRATWDTGWFQAEIVAQLLDELGYEVSGPRTLDNEAFYDGLVTDEVDLWVNGWFPLHEPFVADRDEIVRVGVEVDAGALQGYLVDRATAERLGIEDLGDLADPEIAAEFDRDGNGLADLVGCNPEWSCGPIVDHHLDAYDLSGTVEQVQGSYGPLMQATAQDFRAGEPVLFYTFTPNWTLGELVPGEDVRWLPVPFPSLPDELAQQESQTEVPDVEGCRANPCALGFAPNDIVTVAAQRVLDEHPAVEQLLADFTISLDDIERENARLVSDRPDASDVGLHAEEWIDDNRATVDEWLTAAIDAHVDAGGELAPPPPSTRTDAEPLGAVQVVTRVSPPFVTYEDNRFDGFAIDVWEAVALRTGADYELTAVDSSLKLVDEVQRGSADLAVAATGITVTREERVDFTQPFIESGLTIMVSDTRGGLFGGAVGRLVRQLFSMEVLAIVLFLLGAIAVAAHVVWFAERGKNPDFPSSYRQGIWEAFWWAAVTATTVGYGDRTPKGHAGRVIGLIWMFAGLFLIAYVTAGIASALTLEGIESSIDSVDDLRDHDVGVPAASEAAAQLNRLGIGSVDYPTADDAYTALRDGDVDAVVHDAAILQHVVTTESGGGLSLVGAPFHPQRYGFAVAADSPLEERLNRALLDVVESGDYADIHEKWFGTEPGSE